jgi:acetate kinase
VNILVFNQGSDNLKGAYFKNFDGSQKTPSFFFTSLSELDEKISSAEKIDYILHRVTHGGSHFLKPTLINEIVKNEIHELSNFAPLHNHKQLKTILIAEKKFPNSKQIAFFDTSFHQTLEPSAYTYPIPAKFRDMGIRKYGFHGINYSYVLKESSKFFSNEVQKICICHLGGGSSLAAINQQKCINTTMGFTPLEGLMMSTRSGSIDPGILFFLGKTFPQDELFRELNEKSGLLGLSESSAKMEIILKLIENGDLKAKLSLDVYIHKLVSYIGSMIANLKGIDALIFTGGIGENCSIIRREASKHFEFLNLQIDESLNDNRKSDDRLISSTNSKVKVAVIKANEAFEMASYAYSKF